MAAFVDVAVEDLVAEAIDVLYGETVRPLQVTVGAMALDNAADKTLTLVDATHVNVTDRLEAPDGEIMIVTAKTDDEVPVLTVARSYAGKAADGGHPTTTRLTKNPTWSIHDTERRIRRAVSAVFNRYLPYVTSAVMQRSPSGQWVEMPADTMRVLRVRRIEDMTGRIVDVGGWYFEDNLPLSLVSTGAALRVPHYVNVSDDLIVDYQVPWDPSGATVALPVGGEDLPVLWAVAYSLGRREVARGDVTKIEEWNQEQAIRQGVNLRLLRDLWLEFYRRLDEVRATYDYPKHRPYKRMATY